MSLPKLKQLVNLHPTTAPSPSYPLGPPPKMKAKVIVKASPRSALSLALSLVLSLCLALYLSLSLCQ